MTVGRPDSEINAELDALRDRYADWSVWVSDCGRLYAGRREPRHLSIRALLLGLAMTVDAVDIEGLAAKLAEQSEHAERGLQLWGDLT
jgi:hypothetical protein